MATCDMRKDCTARVTHIGNKGYVYCEAHAIIRRQSGAERTRRMRLWECKMIAQGKPLPSYKPARRYAKQYPFTDWQYEVANGDTVLGLDEWRRHKTESEGR